MLSETISVTSPEASPLSEDSSETLLKSLSEASSKSLVSFVKTSSVPHTEPADVQTMAAARRMAMVFLFKLSSSLEKYIVIQIIPPGSENRNAFCANFQEFRCNIREHMVLY